MEHIRLPPPPACRQLLADYGPRRPGLWRALMLCLLFAFLFGTGLHVEFLAARNWNAGEVVLLLHIILGLVFAAVFLSWIAGHVLRGLPKSQRPGFTWLSWILLAKYAVVLVTGLMMVLPTLIHFGGGLWFWRFEATYVLTFLHLWSAVAAAAGLVVHLTLRHWAPPLAGKRRRAS